MAQQERPLAGCSKSSSSKAAGESKPEAYPQRYVEDFDEPRTKLAGFFSVLLCGLRLSRACGRVRSLHLERGKGLWPQSREKDLSFGIDGAEVAQTVLPLLRLPRRR
jgi:hypothetical protein